MLDGDFSAPTSGLSVLVLAATNKRQPQQQMWSGLLACLPLQWDIFESTTRQDFINWGVCSRRGLFGRTTRPCLPPEGAEFKKSECVKLVVDRQAMKFLWDGQMLRSSKLLLLCPRGADEIKSCPFDSQVEIDRSIRQRHGLIYHWRRSRYNIYWFLRASVYLWERR